MTASSSSSKYTTSPVSSPTKHLVDFEEMKRKEEEARRKAQEELEAKRERERQAKEEALRKIQEQRQTYSKPRFRKKFSFTPLF